MRTPKSIEYMRRYGLLKHWLSLALGTVVLAWALKPWVASASALLAGMLVAILLGLRGTSIRMPGIAVSLSQALAGVAIASTMHVDGLTTVVQYGWAIGLAAVATLAGALATGFALMRLTSLPGTTAPWGCLPGAAAAMGSLASQNGGDGVVVSIMQYLRVALVLGSGSLIAHWLSTPVSAAMPASAPAVAWPEAALGALVSAALAGAGTWIAIRMRISAGTLLVPLVLGAAWMFAGVAPLHVPRMGLDLGFMIIGWSIGLQFRRPIIKPLLLSLPSIFCAVLALMAICGIVAWVLTLLIPINGVTAYLATSPGGLDSVTALGLGAGADMNFVTAMQTARLFSVILFGPALVKFLCERYVRQE